MINQNQISRVTAIYAIIVGALMFAMWAFFLVSGQVPELKERPAEIVLHLLAEFATAIMLVIGGFTTRLRRRSGRGLLTLGYGMLLYTVIVSPGYYISKGETAFVAMFAVLFAMTVALSAGVIFSKSDQNDEDQSETA